MPSKVYCTKREMFLNPGKCNLTERNHFQFIHDLETCSLFLETYESNVFSKFKDFFSSEKRPLLPLSFGIALK